MKLENYELHLPSYSVGKEVYNQIGKICKPYGTKVLVIGGKKALSAAFDKISKNAADGGLDIIGKEIYGTDCTYEAVERLAALTSFQEADMVFAVGGGKAIDTCKCLCIECEKPVFTFPTIASNCAACTSVSIMYHEDGTFFKPHFFTHPAAHALSTHRLLPQHRTVICGRVSATRMRKITKLRFLHAVKNCRIIRRSVLDFPKCA
mgnify:CR=1 FL=1